MSLALGNYTIFSSVRNTFVGSLLLVPKDDLYPVQSIPSNIPIKAPKWTVIPGPVPNKYILKFQSEYDLVRKEGLVWVSKDPSVSTLEWTIESSPQDGPDIFVISGPQHDGIWTTPASPLPYGQIYSKEQIDSYAKFKLNRLD